MFPEIGTEFVLEITDEYSWIGDEKWGGWEDGDTIKLIHIIDNADHVPLAICLNTAPDVLTTIRLPSAFFKPMVEWYTDIPEGGVLCKVDLDNGGKFIMSITERVGEQFSSESSILWDSVVPLTKEEIQIYLDNAPE